MRIPREKSALLDFTKELIEECEVSMENRRAQSRMWRQLFYTGSLTGRNSKHNKCYGHIDKLASYLFSPAEVRFSIDVESDQVAAFKSQLDTASRHINQEFARANCGLKFGQAVELALQDGCSLYKLIWRKGRYEPHIVRSGFFGVLREDIEDLDQQEAFIHTYYLTKSQFARILWNHPDKDEIENQAQSAFQAVSDSDILADTYLREMVTGGLSPISITGQASGSYGNVQVFSAPPAPMLGTQIRQDLIKVTDLWVWDDRSEDYVTIRYAEPDLLIEGRMRLQNLGDVPGDQPFTKICANEVAGYFWGRSELANVAALQGILNDRIDDVDNIFRLQAKPPRSFSGFGSITQEKALALLSAGGSLTEDAAIGAKVENLAPSMPDLALDYLVMIERWFDEAGGFSSVLSGNNEEGVRAGAQLQTLVRTASPRMRDRSLLIEAQCAAVGTRCLKMSAAKNPRVFTAPANKNGPFSGIMGMLPGTLKNEFTLSQLPDSARVVVDSHTSSPAFQGDFLNLAFALQKAGAIDGETLISMTHPPREDEVIQRWRDNQEAQAEMIKQNPQLLLGGKKK